MSKLYIVESPSPDELRQASKEAPATGADIELIVRGLGESSMLAIQLSVDSVLELRDTTNSTASGKLSGLFPTMLIAKGQATLENGQPTSASLTIHPETDIAPGCELEVLDPEDLG